MDKRQRQGGVPSVQRRHQTQPGAAPHVEPTHTFPLPPPSGSLSPSIRLSSLAPSPLPFHVFSLSFLSISPPRHSRRRAALTATQGRLLPERNVFTS